VHPDQYDTEAESYKKMKTWSMIGIAAKKVGKALRTNGPCPAKALASKRARSFHLACSSLNLFLLDHNSPIMA
jgi:hypothetical protein